MSTPDPDPREEYQRASGELPDPHGLLPAAGGRQAGGKLTMRTLRITALEQVGDPAVRALIAAAAVTGIPPIRTRW
jgi:hypothetical protein